MLLTVLLSMGIAAGCLLAGRILFHYFQLESYQFPGYFRTVRRNLLKCLLPGFLFMLLLGISAGLLSLLVPENGNKIAFCLAEIVILAAGGWFIGKRFSEKHAKKAFVLTPRVKRLYIVSFIVLTLMLCIIIRMTAGSAGRYASAILIVFPVLLPLWTALCGLLAWPVEKASNSLSPTRGKPDSPSRSRSRANASRRPVRIL